MAKQAELEYFVLDKIKREDMPVGAVVIHESLHRNGIALSETGVGRLLRRYRKEGTLEKIGNQGHMLTDSGRERLQKLEAERALQQTMGRLFLNTDKTGQHIVDVLIARRAIEVEAANRAARNAAPDEIAALQRIIETQYKGMELGEDYTDTSADFHRTILTIAKVPLLVTLYDFIGISSQWQNFFIGTFKYYNTPLNVHHEMIFHAIERHDPQQAAALMGEHMDNVIDNAKKLLQTKSGKAKTHA